MTLLYNQDKSKSQVPTCKREVQNHSEHLTIDMYKAERLGNKSERNNRHKITYK